MSCAEDAIDIIRDLEHFGTYSHPGSRRILTEAVALLRKQEEELRKQEEELRKLRELLRERSETTGG